MSLQEQLFVNQEKYCSELVKRTAEGQKLDLEMFNEDRNSTLVTETYHSDQVAAVNMNVTEPASAVLFNTRLDDCGVVIRDFDYDSLLKYCQDSIKSANYLEELNSANESNLSDHKIIQYPNLKKFIVKQKPASSD
ncbi:putative uncharacterized protein [Lentilactobacillus kosonis]|uniref:Uncharacterized protein n=1 Tax=Lentilactobacillus kosonis TaxID=2810561 RepID=A0A401FP50_9LACO|nr:DsbA family protein [Lentilactobacillus kosonis]GAY74048.1 putative uncharacterized protein [Lentilactobacillus kosonis]